MILINISGPTSSGKSQMGVDLAQAFGADKSVIISTDSRQIYKGLNIGTGKVKGQWVNGVFVYQGIRHFLIDYISPEIEYNLASYLLDFSQLFNLESKNSIANHIGIQNFNNLSYVILVGGSGLYSKAILEAFQPGILKSEFENQFAVYQKNLRSKNLQELQNMYLDLGLEKLNNSDQNNSRRLISKILKANGISNNWFDCINYTKFDKTFNFMLETDFEVLKSKIRDRFQKRFEQGLMDEIESHWNLGINRFKGLGLEYRIGMMYRLGLLPKSDLLPLMLRENLRYAKRQLTWLNKQKNLKVRDLQEVLKVVKEEVRDS